MSTSGSSADAADGASECLTSRAECHRKAAAAAAAAASVLQETAEQRSAAEWQAAALQKFWSK
jgi:hypothetical protein